MPFCRPRISLILFLAVPLTGCGTANVKSTNTNTTPGTSPSAAESSYWIPPAVGAVNSLGTVTSPVNSTRVLTLLNPSISSDEGPLLCVGAIWDSTGKILTVTYSAGSEIVHATVQVDGATAGMSAQIDADQPLISSADFGVFDSSLNARSIAVPYYSSTIAYAPGASEYLNTWWDWQLTHATELQGTTALYKPKTDGSRNLLHEVLRVVVSPDADVVLPDIGNPASPYIPTLAGRTVLDIWDSGFADIQTGLGELGDYGISSCVGIIHDWQHFGYDDGLPQHYPANDALGGSAGLQAAIAQGKANGCLMAVHENYADYYPDFPAFTMSAVALNSDGTQMKGWRNETTGVQAFSTKPSWILANAVSQSPVLHQNYGTTADCLDVHSAAPISSHGDMDAREASAGMLANTFKANQALWAYERQTHAGPVIGEGQEHWYYSGLLDGVEAQLGAGVVPANSDAALPLFVDFDLLRIHPLQVNHGMGYYERWTSSGKSEMTTTQRDAYRMQEIAFGHAPFLGKGTWNVVPEALVETNLIGPVAKSYGVAHVSAIQYRMKGTWTSPSIAAASGAFSQVQVVYDNDLAVVANAATAPFSWNGLIIPPFGWAAKGDDLTAYTALCGSTICDYSETPTSFFANSRNQADAQVGMAYAKPSIGTVTAVNANYFAITYQWQVYRLPETPANYNPFVHFVDDNAVSSGSDGIVFQKDHIPAVAISTWLPGATISDGPWTVAIPLMLPDGTYSIRVGLYGPASGNRLQLAGINDGTDRYIIGYVTSRAGALVAFTRPPPLPDDPRLNAANSALDFGAIQTDGMVSITKEDSTWILRAYPRWRNVTVLLNNAKFPQPAAVQLCGDVPATVTPVAKGSYWLLPINGAKRYCWGAN